MIQPMLTAVGRLVANTVPCSEKICLKIADLCLDIIVFLKQKNYVIQINSLLYYFNLKFTAKLGSIF